MKFLFVLDSVEAPQAINPQLGRRLAARLAETGHTVHLLELWDGETPPPTPPPSVTLHTAAFADERLMNTALENGSKNGSPVPVRLARLAAHPTAVAAAVRQLVFHRPRRLTEACRQIEQLCQTYGFDAVCAVCAPYRAAFALEEAEISAKKLLWQLDPYASNREYTAPGGAAREARLLREMTASFVTEQALPDYESGPLAACRKKIHTLAFPSLLPPPPAPPAQKKDGLLCVFCGNLHPDIRPPAFALELLQTVSLPGFRLVMAGGGWEPFAAEAARAEAAMGAAFSRPGMVLPENARTLLQSADVLLSIGNTVDNQMPSKVFEYMGMGKPILHLVVNDNDPALPVLARYPLALCLRQADGVTPAVTKALEDWLRSVNGQSLPFAQVVALCPQYTPAAVASKFLAVVRGED